MSDQYDITRIDDERRRFYNPETGEITFGECVRGLPPSRIAYCRVCQRQISAETAAANGGNCNAHAHEAVGARWNEIGRAHV